MSEALPQGGDRNPVQEERSRTLRVPSRKGNRNQAEQLIERVEEKNVVLFHDQRGEPYAAVHGNGSLVLRIESRAFRQWLHHLAWTELGIAVSRTVLDTATQTLQGKAQHEGKRYELHVRVAWHKSALWYDLGDGRAICVTAAGWKIIPEPPILFVRYPHQIPQVEPERGGQLTDLLSFLNIPGGRKGILSSSQLLCLAHLAVAFVPEFAHPALILHGREGSAKTTFAKFLKSFADPSSLDTSALRSDLRELVQFLAHHWLVPFDNVSYISEEVSDILCRAITGEGLSKRVLYSDDEDFIYSFRRVICITGINVAPQKSELLDRSLLIGLERVRRYESEQKLWERFASRKPHILGSIFDVLSKAMKVERDIAVSPSIRMSDFARWGCAVTQALGHEPKVFLAAYHRNLNRRHQEAIEANLAALALTTFMEKRDEWSGQPSDLLRELRNMAESYRIDTRDKSWPKTPSWLWRRLNEARTNLAARGLLLKRSRSKEREIIVRKRRKSTVGADGADAHPSTPDDTSVSIDSIFPT